MSRVGRMPIPIPDGVEVSIQKNAAIVRGPKGELRREFHPDMTIKKDGGQILVTRPSDGRMHRSLHGLTRALLANMVTGVSEGYTKRLEIQGVGYRAEQQEDDIVLRVGFSHTVKISPPPGITLTVERGYRNIMIDGIDKETVGRVAAEIRAVRKAEPYKGKGIRYVGERVRRKAGKAGKVGE